MPRYRDATATSKRPAVVVVGERRHSMERAPQALSRTSTTRARPARVKTHEQQPCANRLVAARLSVHVHASASSVDGEANDVLSCAASIPVAGCRLSPTSVSGYIGDEDRRPCPILAKFRHSGCTDPFVSSCVMTRTDSRRVRCVVPSYAAMHTSDG